MVPGARRRCVGFHGVSASTEMAFRVPVRDRPVNALERSSASLKIESQLSIDKELASIERMKYSGRRLLAPRACAPAAHLHTIESAEESVRMMGAHPVRSFSQENDPKPDRSPRPGASLGPA